MVQPGSVFWEYPLKSLHDSLHVPVPCGHRPQLLISPSEQRGSPRAGILRAFSSRPRATYLPGVGIRVGCRVWSADPVLGMGAPTWCCEGGRDTEEEERDLISPGKTTAAVSVERMEPGTRRSLRDRVAVEEPMEIRVEQEGPAGPETRSVAVTMRTPGNDFELAAGFLFSEGIVAGRDQIREVTYCRDRDVQEYNIVTVRLRTGVRLDESLLSRNFYTSSSCGVCGKASLEAVEAKGCARLPRGRLNLDPELLARLPARLLEGQDAFRRTGGLHAAGLFDEEGELLQLQEDVGRHNAVDKVVGGSLLAGALPLEDRVLVVSGRTSFEILQKAVAAGIPAIVAVGAPSSLAVDLARRFKVTLLGFTRPEHFNLYSGGERVKDWNGVGG